MCVISYFFLYVFQIEDIRNSIDKIDENVAEVKKLYSVILSAPTSDQSEILPASFFSSCPFFSHLEMYLHINHLRLYCECFSDLTLVLTDVSPLQATFACFFVSQIELSHLKIRNQLAIVGKN